MASRRVLTAYLEFLRSSVMWRSGWKPETRCSALDRLPGNLGTDGRSSDPLTHLRSLADGALTRAQEYVGKTPLQICTLVRSKIEAELSWLPIELPLSLFDDAPAGLSSSRSRTVSPAHPRDAPALPNLTTAVFSSSS